MTIDQNSNPSRGTVLHSDEERIRSQVQSNIKPIFDTSIDDLDFVIEAAEKGGASEKYCLGLIYLEGKLSHTLGQDDAAAAKWIMLAAQEGNPQAQYHIGTLLTEGRGVDFNAGEAFYWFKKAALSGHEKALLNLGICCLFGRGVEKDEKQAKTYFMQIAKSGNSWAQYYLGWLGLYGQDRSQGQGRSAVWFRRSARGGNANAQLELGLLYLNKLRRGRDDSKAALWLEKSAVGGNARAQSEIGFLYSTGRGVPKDEVLAVSWFRKSADQEFGHSFHYLGLAYMSGIGVAKNEAVAAYYFYKARKHNIVGTRISPSQLLLRGNIEEKFAKVDFSLYTEELARTIVYWPVESKVSSEGTSENIGKAEQPLENDSTTAVQRVRQEGVEPIEDDNTENIGSTLAAIFGRADEIAESDLRGRPAKDSDYQPKVQYRARIDQLNIDWLSKKSDEPRRYLNSLLSALREAEATTVDGDNDDLTPPTA